LRDATARVTRRNCTESIQEQAREVLVSSFEDGATDDAYFDGPVLLPQEEALDEEEVGFDLDEGYSPGERPRGITAWGTTEREDILREDLEMRLRNEEPEIGDRYIGDGIGDSFDTDGELIDDQVGDARAGRLVFEDLDPGEPNQEYWAVDVGIDGGGASGEEAAMHIVPDDGDSSRDEYDFVPDEDAL
jgi:hypothetical protein